MNWIENILIIGGISLDIFAAMEIEGAMLADIKRKSLLVACGIVILLQMVFFFGGYVSCYELEKYQIIKDAQEIGYIAAVIVFALLGIRLIVKAIRREFVQEKRRDDIRVRDYIKIIAVTSFYTLCAGCVCGFVGTSVVMMGIIILVCSVLVVVSGLYTGYHFGFESKTGAYVAGALLLWAAGGEILLRNVMYLI